MEKRGDTHGISSDLAVDDCIRCLFRAFGYRRHRVWPASDGRLGRGRPAHTRCLQLAWHLPARLFDASRAERPLPLAGVAVLTRVVRGRRVLALAVFRIRRQAAREKAPRAELAAPDPALESVADFCRRHQHHQLPHRLPRLFNRSLRGSVPDFEFGIGHDHRLVRAMGLVDLCHLPLLAGSELQAIGFIAGNGTDSCSFV